MNEDQLTEASNLWKSGMKAVDIATSIGVTMGSLKHHCREKRDMFPERPNPWNWARKRVRTQLLEKRETMRWITENGACVTLPRVSILEGRR